jgi:hypothetical protein
VARKRDPISQARGFLYGLAWALADSGVAQAVIALAAAGDWTGTASHLLEALGTAAGESATRSKAWPSSTRSLGNRLRRLAPGLRAVGVHVDFGREAHTGRRIVVVGKDRGNDVTNVTAPTETHSKQDVLVEGKVRLG